MLHYLAHPVQMGELEVEFGRSAGSLGRIYRHMMELIDVNYVPLLDFDHTKFTPCAAVFAAAIAANARPGWPIIVNCVGFLDGTVRRITRPIAVNSRPVNISAYDLQRRYALNVLDTRSHRSRRSQDLINTNL